MSGDPEEPPLPYPAITPYLFYADAARAVDWLTTAFGFTERRRIHAPDGTVTHAELATGENGVIMFGSPGDEYESPRSRSRPSFALYVRVADPDAHAERSRRAGARLVQQPVDRPWGDREYAAEDLEGHRWVFWSRRSPAP
jgi:PhnB protein